MTFMRYIFIIIAMVVYGFATHAEVDEAYIISLDENMATVDQGIEGGIRPGLLLDIYRTNTLEHPTTQKEYTVNEPVGRALVVSAQMDMAIARLLVLSDETVQVGDRAKISKVSSVRSYTRAQGNIYLNISSDIAGTLKKEDIVEVYRIMQAVHPVTQNPIIWKEDIAKLRITHVSHTAFSARAKIISSVKPLLPGDVIFPKKDKQIQGHPPTTESHVLKVVGNMLYITRFDGAKPGKKFMFVKKSYSTAQEPLGTKMALIRVQKIYKHLVSVVLMNEEEPVTFCIGDRVKLYPKI